MSDDLRKLLLETGLTAALFCCISLLFGAFVEKTPSMPLPRYFSSSILTGKYLSLERALRDGEEVDVVLLGLSPMMMVNAAQLGRELSDDPERPVRSFNLAGPIQPPYMSLELLRQVVEPLHRPRLVVHGLMPLDLLAEALNSQLEKGAILGEGLDYSVRADGPTRRVRQWLLTRFSLLAYREVIRDWIVDAPREKDMWDPAARRFDAWGDLDFRPAPGVEKLSKVELNYRARLSSFGARLKRSTIYDSTRRLARWCAANDIGLVLVNMPIHPLFLDLLPAGAHSQKRFSRRMAALAENLDVPFFEPAPNGPAAPDLFRDSHHHNIAGAEWLTRELAEFLRERKLVPPLKDP